MRKRKIPLRTCVGCGEQKPKRELVRIVRTPEGHVEIDPTGKKSGRGTYLCPKRSCLEKARKGKKIERSLKHEILPDVLDKLAEQLPADVDDE